ncbi:MAG: hypothetical protein IJS63_09460 [Bacteroidaceae bacterium]|nr:hypothetical protein [Bacteroidaceae bacterium]
MGLLLNDDVTRPTVITVGKLIAVVVSTEVKDFTGATERAFFVNILDL